MNEKLEKTCELTNKQAEEVVGGEEVRLVTLMHCDACKWEMEWSGNYVNGEYYNCPICHAKNSFHGIRSYE